METVKLNKRELEKQFNEIYEMYSNSIYRFCMAKLSCDEEGAEDCTQETFLVYYKRLKEGETFDNSRAFLYKTAYNFVLKKYEENKKRNMSEELDGDRTGESFSESIDEKLDLRDLLFRLENELNDDEKYLYKKRFVEEMKISDIACELGISPQTCTVRIHRLKKKLREKFENYMKG